MSGGEWASNDMTSITNTLDPSETRQTAFARLAFDITDDINIYGQWRTSSKYWFRGKFYFIRNFC